MSSSGSLTFDLAQHLVAGGLQDLGPGIVVLVDAVAEAEELEGVGLVLGRRDAVLGRHAAVVDALEHLHHFHVGPAVQRPPQGAYRRGARGEEVRPRRADDPRRRRAAILLVVGVQDEDQVQGVLDFRRDVVLLVGNREHHVQEVCTVAQVGIRDR